MARQQAMANENAWFLSNLSNQSGIVPITLCQPKEKEEGIGGYSIIIYIPSSDYQAKFFFFFFLEKFYKNFGLKFK